MSEWRGSTGSSSSRSWAPRPRKPNQGEPVSQRMLARRAAASSGMMIIVSA